MIEILFFLVLFISSFINISKPFSSVLVRISDVVYLFFIYWALANKFSLVFVLFFIIFSKIFYSLYSFFRRDPDVLYQRNFRNFLFNFLLSTLPLVIITFLVYLFSFIDFSNGYFVVDFFSKAYSDYIFLFFQIFLFLTILYFLYLLIFNIFDFVFGFGVYFSDHNYFFYDSVENFILSNVFNSILFLVFYDLAKINIYLVFLFIIAFLPISWANYNYNWILMAIYHTVEKIADVIESKHVYGKGHSKRVAELCAKFAYKLDLSYEEITKLVHAARIMNVGYVSVPDYIFNKGSLDNYELRLIRRHTENIYNILQKMDIYRDIALIVKYHHECWDGSGYPEGLKGNSIPFLSRVIRICDMFLALIEDRSFRRAYSVEEALKIMDEEKNKFDPLIFEKFMEFVREEFLNKDKVSVS